ncbi:hypothetical protein HYU07_03245 [Candidatus Woesearchaeota archaeon]|nr:hypothetical protein [Candidatus Woesearchaeota archaeon]
MDKAIKYAAIAGIISIAMTIPMVILEVLKSLKMLTSGWIAAYILTYLISLISYAVFIWGFKVIGEKTQNTLLTISSYLLIISSIFLYGYVILASLLPSFDKLLILVSVLYLLIYGVLSLLAGIAVLKLKDRLGSIATATGILNIITGASFLTIILSAIGLLTMMPAYVLEIILLFKASKILNGQKDLIKKPLKKQPKKQ